MAIRSDLPSSCSGRYPARPTCLAKTSEPNRGTPLVCRPHSRAGQRARAESPAGARALFPLDLPLIVAVTPLAAADGEHLDAPEAISTRGWTLGGAVLDAWCQAVRRHGTGVALNLTVAAEDR